MAPLKTILLVDDDRDILRGLQTLLETRGYRVLIAYDGHTGLELAESALPDLVVLDMMMPKKSGFLVLDTLKNRAAKPKVIMMTANDGNRHRAYAELLGVDDYLHKPFPLDQFLATVERLCPATGH
ncbi:MAG: response regulator [Gemmataceae bacterium]|nr:response regulator [Gemmataceae bacterium]